MTQRFSLPKTMQARNWVRSTDALRVSLYQRLASIKTRADAKRKEAEEIEKEAPSLEQAIALLDQLLPPKATPTPISSQADARTVRWSLMHDRCIDCGSSEKKHAAHGRCQACDWNWRHRLEAADAVSATA